VDGNQRAIGLLVEHAAQFLQPSDHQRRIFDQRFHQIGNIGKMPTAHHVQVMDGRRVVGFICRLNTPLGHHGIGITKAQLGSQDDFSPVLARQYRRRSPGPAPANDQHVGVVVNLLQVQAIGVQVAAALHDVGQLQRHALPLAHPDADLAHPLADVVGVESL